VYCTSDRTLEQKRAPSSSRPAGKGQRWRYTLTSLAILLVPPDVYSVGLFSPDEGYFFGHCTSVSKMGYDTDIVIIGAGPAGLAAARESSRADLNYVVMFRENSPCENKPCAGFIPRKGLERFGLNIFPGAHPVMGIRVKFSKSEIETMVFDDYVGVNASRVDIGRAQLSLISSDKDNLHARTRVNSIAIGHEGCRVNYTQDDESGTLTSAIIIDASGANPVSQKTSPIRERIPINAMGYAVQYQMKLPTSSESFGNLNDHYYGREYSPRAYAWVYPRGREVAVGTGGLIADVRAAKKSVTEYLDYLVNGAEPACTDLEGAKVVKKEAALMPLAGIVTPSFSHRLMLAGDASGHCSPISGVGIHYSMIAGELAAKTAQRALEQRDTSSRMLSRYQKLWLKEIGPDLKWGRWLQRRILQGESGITNTKFGRSRRFAQNLADMVLGIRSVRSTIIRQIPSYLRSKIG
jgi:digeranylgeranylglycerophospholipid reductase